MKPELHLDVSTLQRLLLNLDLSTPHGPGLHLDLPGQQEPVRLLEVLTPHGPELHGVAAQQEYVLHLDLSAKQRPAPGRVRTKGACAGLNLCIP
jgi:hypothetical protein